MVLIKRRSKMKKRTWLFLVLIALCLAVFYGYRAVDRLNTDTKAPQISISSGTLQLSVQDSQSALLQGVTAKDETDGDVTASLVVESVRLTDPDGTVSVGYAAFDSAGNVAKASREVQYTDYESPRFTLSAPVAFSQSSGVDVLSIIHVTDMLDGDITHRIRATSLSEEAVTAVGTHEVQFRVTNSLGETAELVLPVEVYPAGNYQASLSLTDYLVYLPAGTAFNPKDYLNSFTVSGEVTSLRSGMPRNFTLQTVGTVDTQTPGVYSVGYTVTYTVVSETNPENNRVYSGYSKLIVVVEE